MRLLICAGGTGGGVYPALAVLQNRLIGSEVSRMEDVDTQAASEILWVGALGGMESDLVTPAGMPFEAIPAAGLHGVGMRDLPGNLWQLGRGVLAARRVLRRFRPQVLFFTGGYVAAPLAAASRLQSRRSRPAILVYVPDVEPGLALKALARFADHIAVTVEETRQYLPSGKPITVTGYPARHDLLDWDLVSARRALGLSPDLPTLLVLGGSRGARSINRALLAALPELLAEMQVVHASGSLEWQEVKAAREQLAERLPDGQAERYHPYPYLQAEIGAALVAADLVLSRSGASSLGEYPLFGLPAILVPYPYAWRYQKVNADYLVERGAALMLADEDLTASLLSEVKGLMADQRRREAMSRAMRTLARPQAADAIGELLCGLAVQRNRGRI